jgi:hypothetical protein
MFTKNLQGLEPRALCVLGNGREYAQRNRQRTAAIFQRDHRFFAVAHGIQK